MIFLLINLKIRKKKYKDKNNDRFENENKY